VYQVLPIETRAALDAALLTRPADCPTIAAAHEKLRLGELHGISPADVARYAKVLEEFARPLMASLAVSSLLNALPRRMLSGLTRGNRLLVWSRLVQHLTDEEAPPLKAGDYAKLAALLEPARRTPRRPGLAGRAKPALPHCRRGGDGELAAESLATLAREVYGTNLADDILKDPPPTREGDRPASSDPGRESGSSRR